MKKIEKFNQLIEKMSLCEKCVNLKGNNKQDWGPYHDMDKFYQEYVKDKREEKWKRITEQEQSMTKKMLKKYLILSAKNNNMNIEENILDDIYVTNAIMCARKDNRIWKYVNI